MALERTDRVNWSTLKAILTSPRHYRHGLVVPREDTDALLLGRVLHAMVYEPDQVGMRYVVSPRFHSSWGEEAAKRNGFDGGKAAKEEWERANVGREVVTADMHSSATAMRDSLLSDPIARAFIDGGLAEQPIEWTDGVTGIQVRGRVDHINGRLSDLKSTARIAAFQRQAASLMYHAQLAFYSDGLEANGFEFLYPPVLIAVESVAPFDVAVYTLDDDTLAAGRALYRRALDTLAECRKHDLWPGVGGGAVQRLALPAWALTDPTEEEITMGGEPVF